MFVLSAMDYWHKTIKQLFKKTTVINKTITVSVQKEWLFFNIPFFFIYDIP